MAKHIENSQLMFVDGLKKEYFPSIFFLPNFFLVILGGRWEQLAKSNRNLPAKKECNLQSFDPPKSKCRGVHLCLAPE